MTAKFLTLIAFLVAVVLITANPVVAAKLDITDRKIIKESAAQHIPDQIIITPIFQPNNEFLLEDSAWYKSVWYYTISRLGFPDIPFHYVVSNYGDTFTGNRGGVEQKVAITNEGSAVVVGYLAKLPDTNFDNRAIASLSDVVVEVANKYSINLNNVKVLQLELVKNEAEKFVSLRSKPAVGLWQSGLTQIVNNARSRYKPTPLNFQISVSNVKNPSQSVNIGDKPVVSLDITNTGTLPIAQGGNYELVASVKSNAASKFYVNNLWASPSSATIMEKDTVIKPGETKTVSFRLEVPLYFGKQSESFIIKNLSGKQFSSTSFTVSMNVNRPKQRVVQVLSTEIGYLRVRQTPSTNGAEISRLSQGERYIVLEDLQNGWIRLQLRNDKSGWVSTRYTRNV